MPAFARTECPKCHRQIIIVDEPDQEKITDWTYFCPGTIEAPCATTFKLTITEETEE